MSFTETCHLSLRDVAGEEPSLVEEQVEPGGTALERTLRTPV
jgi:hypothetical protein